MLAFETMITAVTLDHMLGILKLQRGLKNVAEKILDQPYCGTG